MRVDMVQSLLLLGLSSGMVSSTQLPLDLPRFLPRPAPIRTLSSYRSHRAPPVRHDRALQTTVNNFRIDYVARFQLLQTALCQSPSPVVRVYCDGGTLDVDTTLTDARLPCDTPIEEESGLAGLECVVECGTTATDDCTSLYTNDGTRDILTGPYGEVFFSCTGPDLDSVTALSSWEDTGDGMCTGESQVAFKFAQLGVRCGSDAGTYSTDDHYADCALAVPFDGTPGNVYTCASGIPCDTPSATTGNCVVSFAPLLIVAQPYNYDATCVTSLSGATVPDARPDETDVVDTVQIVARFNASWSVATAQSTATGDRLVQGSCAPRADRTITLTCTSPNAAIVWIALDTSASVDCTATTTTALVCTDSSEPSGNMFQTVIYTCSSGAIPSTTVELAAVDASCSGTAIDATVVHSLQLSPYCEAVEGFYQPNDFYTECGPENSYSYTDDNGFTCSSVADFAASATASQTVPSVVVSTDSFWNGGSSVVVEEVCLTISEGNAPVTSAPASTPTVPTRPAPTPSTPAATPTRPTPRAVMPQAMPSPNPPTPQASVPTPATTPTVPTPPRAVPSATRPTAPVPTLQRPTLAAVNISFVPPTNIAPITDLKGYIYGASYVGQFQYLLDSSCEGPNPMLLLYCLGDMVLTGRSDQRIQCLPIYPESEDYIAGADGFQCQMNCTNDETCGEIFLNKDRGLGNGPFGQVYFQCTGDTVLSTTAIFGLSSSVSEATCPATLNNDRVRNFRLARLGVACPDDDGTGQAYSYDDYYFECLTGEFIPFADDPPAHEYVCVAGELCGGAESCTFELTSALAQSSVLNFADGCVVSSRDVTPAPTPGVPSAEDALLLTSVVFQATWGVQYDTNNETFVTFDCQDEESVDITVSCPNSNIVFVNTTSDEISCQPVGDDTLVCTDTNVGWLAEYRSNVNFECSGATLPYSVVEYPSTNAYCSGNDRPSTVRHALQLGIYCEVIQDFFFGDLYRECGNSSSQFDWVDDLSGNSSYLTCYESSPWFPPESTATFVQPVPALSMRTDDEWLSDAESTCFTLIRQGATATLAPTSAPPTATPTVLNTTAPMVLNTTAPMVLNTTAPTVLNTILPNTTMPSTSPVTLAPMSAAPVALTATTLAPVNALARSSSMVRGVAMPFGWMAACWALVL